ncbi:class B sortase, LPKTxAVK-specific [Streptococcus acidominimus]|uniref:Sortase n=1 Tax=Streptococcus acidominimus TaxID=1326 RepID=A0A1Q8ECR5_STRAI|nr:class B sortase, LPKTxAVK-specific [Streptococcus acidominimus]MBF0848674.1 class B sortase [Streptococcus danieliae]MBF0818083.1 class B sortase [Streptococcus acidominimus]MBF0837862.1 class B sortase [Streptococcus acidominimus]OLF49575.1 SrtB family sortase [Streptococcus acidominimus]TFU31601.1 class B sortase [Streptococcus acidominimus]
MRKKSAQTKKWIGIGASLFVALLAVFFTLTFFNRQEESRQVSPSISSSIRQTSSTAAPYQVSIEEKEYLTQRFAPFLEVNAETIAYVYAPGTKLDEPVVQTTDNATYLDKTFDGNHEPYMGTVFMDTDNRKDFQDQLTWLFGHARGSQVPDNRMFNDVNFYDDQHYFDTHPYVVIETPERKYYYEAAFLIIVPENTAFYRTKFASNDEFKAQLEAVSKDAATRNSTIKINADDRYLVLSTCREEDETIRSNLYLRQIPDKELIEFLANHGNDLGYVATR